MLGCQDFCGHYDWTFGYLERKFGQDALAAYWSEAISGESQSHYRAAGQQSGLRGLLQTWVHTGEDEHCDWTFTLDEARNTLRWDMRKCPSKGFLLQNDLNASEDYCDHCMGWIIPLLDQVGAEIVDHEHNHCGQCWAEISMKDRPRESLQLAGDIRDHAQWRQGYLDRWRHGRQLPLLSPISASVDPCDVIEAWFAKGPSGCLCTDDQFAADCDLGSGAAGVLIGHPCRCLTDLSKRFLSMPPQERPLLLHLYLPGREPVVFVACGLPRPVPVLPLLIRRGRYVHRPGQAPPTTTEFLTMLAEVLTIGRVEPVSPSRPSCGVHCP